MDILEESFGATPEPIDLDSLTETYALPSVTPPTSAIRNRAATTALLSNNPEKAVENFQLMMLEGEQGKNDTLKGIQENIQSSAKSVDMKTAMLVLGDKTVDLETKKGVLGAIKKSQFLEDSSTVLQTNALVAPSEGETFDNEDARISVADSLREMYEGRNLVQGIQNAHGATLKGASADTFFEMLALYVAPFGNSVNTAKVAKSLRERVGQETSGLQFLKDFLLPGSATMDMRKTLENIPPAERPAFAKAVVEALSQSSGVIFNDSQFAQFDKASAIFDDGGYSDTVKWLDNITPLLDAIGIGQFVRGFAKGAKAGSKVAKAVETPAHVASDAVQTAQSGKAAQGSKEWNLKPAITNDAAERSRLLKQLEEERAGLLGDAGNVAEKGGIQGITEELNRLQQSAPKADKAAIKERAKELQETRGLKYKDAEKEASKEISEAVASHEATVERLQTQVDTNAITTKANQRLAEIDSQIESLKKGGVDSPGRLNPIADLVRRIEIRSVTRTENPSSPAAILQQSNPEKARAVHEMVSKASDEVAEAAYGTTKNEALASDILPQVTTEGGAITSKVPDIERNLRRAMRVGDDIMEQINNSGGVEFTMEEKRFAMAAKWNDFKSAEGLTMIPAMGSVRSAANLEGRRVIISAVYGAGDGAFSNAEAAFMQAKHALRGHGILDEEITILAKQGTEHVPVSLDEVKDVPGNYYVRIDTAHEINPSEIVGFQHADVKRNLLDRIPALVSNTRGSASRWLFDASSMLNRIYTDAATEMTDKTARFQKVMLEIASDFSDQYVKLDKTQQKELDLYIKEANYNGIAFDVADLKLVRGFSDEQVETLRSWRDFWDAHFYLENYDVVRSLRSQGYQMFSNANTELYAKPAAKNQNIVRVYDPATDSVIKIDKAFQDQLYNANGTLAKLRRPTDFGGEVVEHMIVRNTPTEYLRAFRDSDKVLNYREGYFQIQYKAPRFVDEAFIDADGVEKWRAVAVAGDWKEAEAFKMRMEANNGGKYKVRGDEKAIRIEDDAYWDLQSASGRIAQRHRGKLLEDSSGLNHLGEGSYIMDPVKSAEMAAKSIAGRTVTRPVLETMKARFLDQYKDMMPSNGMGGVRFPKSQGEIISKGMLTDKRVADARTTFEYINYLENGYINGMDNGLKQFFNMLALEAGKRGFAKTERGLMALSEAGLTTAAKQSVFMSYIGTNILRQWVVQPHQVVRTWSYNPKGWLSGQIEKNLVAFIGDTMGVRKSLSADEQAFIKFVEDSGMLDAVDKSNLVRGTLMEASESSNKAARAVGYVPNLMRKYGFDIGEQGNLLGHLAAVYDKKIREGVNLSDKAARDIAYSEARALSYEMNFAGDMPYNQTSPALFLQFMQVPHKALLQLTNRKLDKAARLRMFAADLVMWGTPAATIAAIANVDVLPENETAREIMLDGAESWALNALFSKIANEDQDIDFSSFAPYELTGWKEFALAMYEGGALKVALNSPAGQLYLKDNGRVRNLIRTVGRAFGAFEDPMNTVGALEVLKEFAKISSGFNNYDKMSMLLRTRKAMDKGGIPTDQQVTEFEAYAQLLGFGTKSTKELYALMKEMQKDTKGHRERVRSTYEQAKQYYYSALGTEFSDPEQVQRVVGFVLNTYGDDPVAQGYIRSWVADDLRGKDQALLDLFLKRAQIMDTGGLRDKIKRTPLPEETKEQMYETIRTWEEAKMNKEKE